MKIDLPHRLGAEEAKRRLRTRIGRLKDHIPGGAAEVTSSWEGDRMNLRVQALGQEISGHVDVFDTKVHLELMLPAFLAMFGSQIEALLRRGGTELLEDRSGLKDA
jgi:hypothetical protein